MEGVLFSTDSSENNKPDVRALGGLGGAGPPTGLGNTKTYPNTPESDVEGFYPQPRRNVITLGDFRDRLMDYGVMGGVNEWENFSYVLRRVFMKWLKQPLYLVFEDEENDKLIFRQGSKRGNIPYVKRGIRRLIPVVDAMKDLDRKMFVHRSYRKIKTKSLFITLTVDPSVYLGDREQFWHRIGYFYDKFKRAVLKKYGQAFVIRGVIESTMNGYPHIHLLMFFKEREFNCFVHRRKVRIEEKRELEKYWDLGFMDIQGIRSLRQARSYAMKYAVKAYNPETCKPRDREAVELTLAMNWFFRKHGFTFSYLRLLLNDLICNKQNSHDSLQEVHTEMMTSWIFLGVMPIGRVEGNEKKPPWVIICTKKSKWGLETLRVILGERDE